ncbi:hypothetical protein EDC01DRAFT_616360, partial [Geopyxis carbonaria]
MFSSSPTVEGDINSFYLACAKCFQSLTTDTNNCEKLSQLEQSALNEEFTRFRVWSHNSGAHRGGRMSLDYRLREASKVKQQVIELLDELRKSLEDVQALASGNKTSYQLEFESTASSNASIAEAEFSIPVVDYSSDLEATTELEELTHEVQHIITTLFKFSIATRNPAPRDLLERCANIEVSHFEFFDIQHISNKFSGMIKSPEGNSLVERLGKANTRRRQILKYHRKHHEKIAAYPEKEEEEAAETVFTRSTVVSTYVPPKSTQHPYDLAPDNNSDTGISQTSFATSNGGVDRQIRVPPPPNQESALDGEPFQCPYCYAIKTVRSPLAWMRHVFRDLRPYICTFKDCAKPDQLFETRHDWFEHELAMHRREWFCNKCQESFPSSIKFQKHLGAKHSKVLEKSDYQTFTKSCERAIPVDSLCPCVFCESKFPLLRLRSHLARHLQQIALFALPNLTQDEDEEEDGDD